VSGESDTLSLRVEKLYQEYQTQAAFTVASLLLFLAVVTLVIKSVVEWRVRKTLDDATRKADVA
jgi:sulfate transport system permease protein